MDRLFTEDVLFTLGEKWNENIIESLSTRASITGRDLASGINANLLFWRELGILKGSKIALCFLPGLNWIEFFLSVCYSDYVLVALPGDFKSAIDAAKHSDCKVLYIQPSDYSMINKEDFKCLEYIISPEDNKVLWSSHPIKHPYQRSQLSSSIELPYSHHYPNDLALIIYTSGTSTRIKGVMLSFRNISSCLHDNYSRFPYAKNKSYLSILPLNHIFGLMYDLLLPLCVGMSLFILDSPPIPELILPALRKVRPIMLFSVPVVLYKLMEEVKRTSDWDVFSSCRMIICGGAEVDPSFSTWIIKDLELPFAIGYGMTECSPTICAPDMAEYEVNSCGKPVDSLQFRIDSSDPEHVPGEVLVKGDALFMGYYKDDALTKQNFTQDGWFKTGVLAFQSVVGNVFLRGRKDSQFSSSSGKNIFLEDIEVLLRTCPDIRDAILVLKERKLIAYVVPMKPINKLSIKAFVNQLNSHFCNGIYISEIQYLEKIERTEKGTIKRSYYQPL